MTMQHMLLVLGGFVEEYIAPPTPGTTFSWGRNYDGQLGDITRVDKSSPVSVVGGYTDWIAISAGNVHSLSIRSDGTAWAWGNNQLGRLGDGTTVGKSSPVSVVGGFTDWTQVGAGLQHSIGLRSNGTLWSWGYNFSGALGDSTSVAKSSPVSVVGGFTDWVQISAGQDLNIALRENGTAWAWGNGAQGRLGNNSTTNRSSPVSVVGGFTDWTQVSAGALHGLGLRENGTAWAWGSDFDGQLGDNTTIDKSSPVSVLGGFTDWTQLSAGSSHSLGLRENGTLWAWGANGNGRLGDNTTVRKSSPVSIVGGFTDWTQIDAGGSHNFGLRANGTAWAWGRNYYGILGDNTTVAKSSPVSIVGGYTDWIRVSAGGNHSLGTR
jgi:alpha-tubulin suppressor-like RCC1 family protein